LDFVNNIPAERRSEPLLKIIEEMIVVCSTFTQFYFTLSTFNVKYSHLFKYDFSCKEFLEFTDEAKVVKDTFDRVVTKFTGQAEVQLQKGDLTLSKRFQELAHRVINDIRKEVLTKDLD
jgi:hypothetical protein